MNDVHPKNRRSLLQEPLFAVAASGTDVYVAVTLGAGAGQVATLWKNGTPMALDHSGKLSRAEAIALDGTDVYVGGAVGGVATVWKNGMPTTYATGSYDTTNILGLAVSVTGVYAVGTAALGPSNPIATSWDVNGTPTYLNDGTQPANASALAVSGTTLYISGYVGINAMLWTNAAGTITSTDLAGNATNPAYAEGIALVGTDVYVAGAVGNQVVTVWKNGTPTSWTDGLAYVDIYCMAVSTN